MKKTLVITFLIVLLAVSLHADVIMLKDSQEFAADVVSFDEFYLVVKLAEGQELSIPWIEVAGIKHTTTEPNWLEEIHITPEDTDVATLVVPLSKDVAFQKALFPGFAMHGAGHFYAKDKNTGMSVLSAEILSLILMGLSVAEIIQPEAGSQASFVSQIVFFTGLTVFGGSWLYDVIFCGGSVDKFNSENNFLIQEKKDNADSAGK